ncbi:hypothetical protein V493_01583 [Pseudogymnoascus sp. VKM F-4281 (FW-2241)]|nr:hypothetical protein V493_01583 [Pseudogymnoascus sp. VKM F-4281 (FW-2241)]
MHLSAFVALAILACANALANSVPESPMDAISHTVNLFNGVSTNPTIVGNPDTPVIPMGPRNMCSGSALCTNKQKFRDQCYEAYTKLNNIVYTTNGNGAGGNLLKPIKRSGTPVTVRHVVLPINHAPMDDAGSSSITCLRVIKWEEGLIT